MKKHLVLLFLGLLSGGFVSAQQQVLTLQECRQMATTGNKKQQIDQENMLATKYLRQSMFARFFPQVSANGAYMYNSRNAYLLPQQLSTSFGSIGLDGLSFNNPILQGLSQTFPTVSNTVNQYTGGLYRNVYNHFELDMTHIVVGQVGVIQPIYVGGRIREGYRLSKSIERLAQIRAAKNMAETTVSVDEAYWRVVSVKHKQVLATQYAALLRQLMTNIEEAAAEGVATQAEVLNVRVKLNEAETALMQADDGLILSKMALCQLIGMPLDSEYDVDDSGLEDIVLNDTTIHVESVMDRRQEIQMLEEMHKMSKAGVRLAAAGLQPNIVAAASYIVTNPNVANGFQNNFAGFFTAGVAVNIPIAHAADILTVKAAKHQAKTAELQIEEAREKIELQVTQSAQKVMEANHKLIRAQSNIRHTEENLRYAQESYNEGVITAADLMMAQTAWQKAYSDKIDAAIELRMAEITYKKNTGQL